MLSKSPFPVYVSIGGGDGGGGGTFLILCTTELKSSREKKKKRARHGFAEPENSADTTRWKKKQSIHAHSSVMERA